MLYIKRRTCHCDDQHSSSNLRRNEFKRGAICCGKICVNRGYLLAKSNNVLDREVAIPGTRGARFGVDGTTPCPKWRIFRHAGPGRQENVVVTDGRPKIDELQKTIEAAAKL